MAVIWEHGPMTVKEIIPLIKESLHFNTISTVVRELHSSGYLYRSPGIRPFIYYPEISRDEYLKEIITTITDRFFCHDKIKFAEAFIYISEARDKDAGASDMQV